MSRMATKGGREVEDDAGGGGAMTFRYPPGFRFHPTDEELVRFYLREKVNGNAMPYDVVADVDLYKCEPWELPNQSMLGSQDLEWFFFSPRDRKYPNGARTNRATRRGYWKATGRDRYVKTGSKTIGMKKTLVFYMGRAPQGERTDWLMHEYRLDGEDGESTNASQDAYVLCRVFKKNGVDVYKAPGSSGRDGHSSGPDGQDNNADSISDEQNSAISEYEEKPSLELPPLPSSNSTQAAPLTAVPLDQQVMGPLAVSFPLQPADGQQFSIGMENFDLDDIQFKSDGFNVDWLPDFCVADDNTDIMTSILESQTPGLIQEFSGEPQSTAGFAYANYGGSFDDLALPPLTEQQSPSPPMFPHEDCVGGDALSQNSTIQIRSRLPSSMRSPNPKALGGFTARRFIKFGKRQGPSIAKDEHREVSESEETSVLAEKESKSGDTESNVDDAQKIELKACNSVTEEQNQAETGESAGDVASPTQSPASIVVESPASSFELDSLPDSVPSIAAIEPALALPRDDVQEQEAGSPSNSAPTSSTLPTKNNSNLDSFDHHPVMKSSVSNVDNQKSVAGMFHIKRYGELPPGIGAIHVNAVTISCSCDKVSVKPHAQATVCDCYNNSKLENRQVLQGSGGRDHGQGCENRRVGFWKGFIPVFLMGAVSACVGFLVFKRCVHIVTPVSELPF